MMTVALEGKGDLAEWRNAARRLLTDRVRPEHIDWRIRQDAAGDLFGAECSVALPRPTEPTRALTVPKAFLTLAEAVVCHSNPARFALLYRVLHRLQEEPALLAIRPDADVAQLHAMEKSVRRDCHKMTAFVRFKEIGPNEGRCAGALWPGSSPIIILLRVPRRFSSAGSPTWTGSSPRPRARRPGTAKL